MSKFLLAAIALLAFAGLTSAADAPAADGAKPYPLKTCIVSDEKLEEDTVVKVYNGQEVKFCCKKCIKDFEKDQAKYLKKLDADHKDDKKDEKAGEPHHDK